MNNREDLSEIWNSIFFEPIGKKMFNKKASDFIDLLITTVLNQDMGSIFLRYENTNESSNFALYPGMKPTSSFITNDVFNQDKELLLKYNQSQIFELEIRFIDEHDNSQKFIKTLKYSELEKLPVPLIKLMQIALKKESVINFSTMDYTVL